MLHQSFRDFELLVINDRLEEVSLADVENLARSDGRIRVVDSKIPGLASALNAGIKSSVGELLARLDSDDLMFADRLEVQVGVFDSNPKLDVLGSQALLIQSDGSVFGSTRAPLTHAQIRLVANYSNPMIHPSVMMRRRCVEEALPFDAFFSYGEDFDFFRRKIASGAQFLNLPFPLIYYRVGSHQMSSKLEKVKHFEHLVLYGNRSNGPAEASVSRQSRLGECYREYARTKQLRYLLGMMRNGPLVSLSLIWISISTIVSIRLATSRRRLRHSTPNVFHPYSR